MFEKAMPVAKRLKMLIYGPTGTGKTVTSLHFPGVACIDTEKGTDFYGDMFDFQRDQTSNPDAVNKLLDNLLKDPGDIKTLVVDPIGNIYEEMQTLEMIKKRKQTGDPNYTLEASDYKTIKPNMKLIIQKIRALDMNIIVTARSKVLYSQVAGDFMKPIGIQFDGPKDIDFEFDVVLKLSKDEEGNFLAIADKDRTNKLPRETFPFTYDSFVKYIGLDTLERKADVSKQVIQFNDHVGRSLSVSFKGKEIQTAGVTEEQLNKLHGVDTTKINKALKNGYGVVSVLDLREDEANNLIEELIQTK